jgi:REP element-mobilizing transposase RayT
METQKLFNEYGRNSHSVGISIWHFEWCTKYRYNMFKKEEQIALATACIRRAASLHLIKIVVLTVMPEHVHCEAEIPLSMSPSQAYCNY